MKRLGFLLLGLALLPGCRAAHDVAVSSFHVLDAPANYVRRKIRRQQSDDYNHNHDDRFLRHGHYSGKNGYASHDRATAHDDHAVSAAIDHQTKPQPTILAFHCYGKIETVAEPIAHDFHADPIPTAKPVPGKPGYVFSPFDASGGYVDVTGYTSGQKVKDPYSGKIFLVP